ncbi:hypothetical protein [Phosphitispora fastidiosa]|uniref:hypothetical protein n=1 Tax=Phosphitispora fastidiosa TaxID=2837202 RepID=UPI001E3783DE|nr:hypothetical protein [Phosphitispora fastidiosa]MBU7006482.1 hypothetical protein [Phosphitispora fastidiosa]
MSKKHIEFEAKIKIKDKVDAKTLLGLLKQLTKDLGFAIKKIESDEITLFRAGKTPPPKGNKTEPAAEVTEEAGAEIEIEVSSDELEIEIESENIETVKDLASKIAALL